MADNVTPIACFVHFTKNGSDLYISVTPRTARRSRLACGVIGTAVIAYMFPL